MTYSNNLNIYTSNKPELISSTDYDMLGSNINIIGYDPLRQFDSTESVDNFIGYDKPMSPRLLNYVEPIVISGFTKTILYTEVNSGLKKGDRVFIIGGVYDSNDLIKNKPYSKNANGYTILDIDRCKIILDIDYIGLKPHNDDNEVSLNSNYIKVYNIQNEADFINVNREIYGASSSNYKFEANNNNVIHATHSFFGFDGWGENLGLTGGPGFFVKNGTQSWIKITGLTGGDISSLTSSNSNNRLFIMNESFDIDGISFKEESIYKYDNGWIIDSEFNKKDNNRPIITKSNFRNGSFSGSWNGGVYGNNIDRITWSGDGVWNIGTLLNVTWEKGRVNSNYSLKDSWRVDYKKDGIPTQKKNNPDNNGRGYNFIINSELKNYEINNSNVSNTTMGATDSSLVLKYMNNEIINYNEQSYIKKAYFDNCRFNNAVIKNSEIKDSRASNSIFDGVISLNSNLKSSVFVKSKWITDNIIKILDYDILPLPDSRTIFKFFIDERAYEKLKIGDNFYIDGIKSNDIIGVFDRKFTLSSFKDNDIEYSVRLSTPYDNAYTDKSDGEHVGYTIDIEMYGLNPTKVVEINNITEIDITDAYIADSDFDSGLFTESRWNSGNHINSNHINTITGITFSIDGLGLEITLLDDAIGTIGDYYKVGDIVYLNAMSQIDTNNIKLNDSYLVGKINSNSLLVATISSSDILSSSTTFSTGLSNSNIYLHKAKIDSSLIRNGRFIRSYIKNTKIKNDQYDRNDIDFINLDKIKKLIISESLFNNSDNILDDALYYKSHIKNTNQQGGIIYNSTWYDGQFNSGTFKESIWINGQFNDGILYKNKIDDYVWFTGEFKGGKFLDSNWINGTFSGGLFTESIFKTGSITGGVIGDNNTTTTIVENATIDYTTVNGATLKEVTWKDGYFKSGIFGSTYSSEWRNGIFENGDLVGNTKWLDGQFKGGRFLSTYGSTHSYASFTSSSLLDSDYSWKYGRFEGGVFGNANGMTNSTWYDGEFYGGKFMGRAWNNGIFISGDFIGSGLTASGWVNKDLVFGTASNTGSYASDFVDSYVSTTYSLGFYGLWVNGVVSDRVDRFITDKVNYGINKRSVESDRLIKRATIKNTLWLNGTFSHTDASIVNSVWLKGNFYDGLFKNSSFNPHINDEFNVDNKWVNGRFDGGDIYKTVWENGTFVNGDAWGITWSNGIAEYMNAYNVFWEGGEWKNGNWNGSIFTLGSEGDITKKYFRDIMSNGDDKLYHVWNIFDGGNLSKSKPMISGGAFTFSSTATNINCDIISPTASFLYDCNSAIMSFEYVGVSGTFNNNVVPTVAIVSFEYNTNINLYEIIYETTAVNITSIELTAYDYDINNAADVPPTTIKIYEIADISNPLNVSTLELDLYYDLVLEIHTSDDIIINSEIFNL